MKPAWIPTDEVIANSNISSVLKEKNLTNFLDLYNWSITNREDFWKYTLNKLGIVFNKEYNKVLFQGNSVEDYQWLSGAKLNIAESCFQANGTHPAIVFKSEGGTIQSWTYDHLRKLSGRVANSLFKAGIRKGDAIGIAMPMTAESVAIYLGIVRLGAVVVSIADSFAPDEIAIRLKISKAKAVFTQDVLWRGGKKLPMYNKVVEAAAEKIFVLPAQGEVEVSVRSTDLIWKDFLNPNPEFDSEICDPEDPINILFSSGTTGEPKAIPWTHTTPIKCASDGYYHQDIHAGDVVSWPTNLGWMMGPWLIYATLINRGTIGLYYGPPTVREFGEFVQDANVNVLGLVPSIVKTWRSTDCMRGFNWRALKLFSSTGECSNADDYLFVMGLGGNKPVIEYCGGTEIGGGYLSGTIVQPAVPSTFTTPCLGLELIILDEESKPCKNGELYIIPPSIGLSQTLLNKDHHEVYFADTPKGPDGQVLRRHGDQVEILPDGYWRAHGRADDTMNLGGIKVSSAEIERTLNQVEGVRETAAVAINPPGGGPSLLVIFVVSQNDSTDLMDKMQKTIRSKLNPLFKIHDLVRVESLPRTASNKVMRRVLRSQYKI